MPKFKISCFLFLLLLLLRDRFRVEQDYPCALSNVNHGFLCISPVSSKRENEKIKLIDIGDTGYSDAVSKIAKVARSYVEFVDIIGQVLSQIHAKMENMSTLVCFLQKGDNGNRY